MRSLFGALFGLVIGILVSALLKNNQLFKVLEEIFKDPSYLSLIIVLAIFGWLIGMSRWKTPPTISSEKDDKKENKNYISIEGEIVPFLILTILGVLVSISKCPELPIIFILLNELLWIFWLLIRHDRMNWKWFRKSPPAGSGDKNTNKPG